MDNEKKKKIEAGLIMLAGLLYWIIPIDVWPWLLDDAVALVATFSTGIKMLKS